MRLLFSLAFLFLFQLSIGQTISGKIRDKFSFTPLLNVKVQSSKGTTYSDGQAQFNILVAEHDSIIFTLPSYRKVVLLTDSLKDLKTIFVEMIESSIPIEEITVKAKAKKDSIKFKLNLGIPKTPKYRQVILDRSSISNSPSLKSAGSTSSLITVDLLSLSRMIFKKKPKVSLEKTMEEDMYTIQYIDMKFSIELIEEITGLKGDDAIIFQNTYRPSIYEFRKMSDIDLREHIKKCFQNSRIILNLK